MTAKITATTSLDQKSVTLTVLDTQAVSNIPASPTPDTRFKVKHPSSGNIQGSGLPIQAQYLLTDENWVIRNDAVTQICEDPSALCNIFIGGTPAAGDTITLTFHVDNVATVVSHIVVAGQTANDLGVVLANKIKANAALYVPVSADNTSGGGLPAPILYAVGNGASVALDYDMRRAFTVDKATTGNVTIGLSAEHPNAPSKALDANPTWLFCRYVPGYAWAPHSNLVNWVVGSNSTGDPHSISVQYANGGVEGLNSTTGSYKSRWFFLTPDENGAINRGIYMGAGIYGASAISGDMGVDTANFAKYYINGVDAFKRDLGKRRKSATQDITTLNNFTMATWDTDVNASPNFTGSQYIASRAGDHFIDVALDLLVGVVGTPVSLCYFKNGQRTDFQTNEPSMPAWTNKTLRWSDYVHLEAGDTVDFRIYTTQKVQLLGGPNGSRMTVKESV
jgi:hypothetical protein